MEDRNLSDQEQSFLGEHSDRCDSCRKARESMHVSLNMLRSLAFEAETEKNFDRRVLRKLQVQTVKESFSYWTPAMIGCALAFVAIFSTLDLLATHGSKASLKLPNGEALRDSAYPRFELSLPPHFDR